MAFAAVDSLLHTIEDLRNSSRISVDFSTRESLQSAHEHAGSLRSKLKCCSEGVTEMDELIIIEEARKLEDAIEIPLSTLFLSPAFNQLREDVYCFAKTAKEMEENIEELWEQKAAKMIEEYVKELFLPKEEEEEDEDVSSECDMVGLSDQFLEIRNKLNPKPKSKYYSRIVDTTLVWISGMAGIGKTVLAKKIYHDPSVKANFECRAFVRVGQECRIREVLQAIAAQLDPDCEEIVMKLGEESQCFFRIATVRKSLIVLDDVWDSTFVSLLLKAQDFDRNSRSRIMVTSRTDLHQRCPSICEFKMRLMNEEESWELLRRNVFGDLECPPELVKVGKKIAEKCEGLPLLIIAVAPVLLSKAQMNVEDWNRSSSRKTKISYGGSM